eukprot:102572-Prorocentrum_minimum.AAC.1
MAIWEAEKRDAATRKEKHFAKVQRKQVLAKKCREELVVLKSEKREAEQNRDSYSEYTRVGRCPQYDQYDAKVDRIQSRINSKNSELKKAEESPEAVRQPLPQAEALAFQALFFLYMPRLYRVVSCM